MSLCIVYMTAADRDEALRIGRALVDERLAACVNVLGEITSIFRWDGAVQQEGEVAFIAKTSAAMVDALAARVTELHSYDTPCVVALPIAAGAAPFLKWLEVEVGEGA
ncbi:divalent-cation tolerance protein CutA [Novispirillum sp. DQ9]|uniref:divalent-cation tolerance protein CutA n=1 Tax=Novispirillum sp. DQ9 TaxID=3398612 RepID=UPI003C797F56